MEGLDPARDRQRLLGLYPTAFCPPQRFGFQAHMGDTVSILVVNVITCIYLSKTLFFSTSCQVTQIASQPQVQAELTLRLTQLQTRLASLKIENEEVSWSNTVCCGPSTLTKTPTDCKL